MQPLIYFDYGLKNKRRIMEDKTACYENIEILNPRRLYDLKQCSVDSDDESNVNQKNGQQQQQRRQRLRPGALFGVFDGHCGADCAQYTSTHLPMAIIDRLSTDEPTPEQVAETFRQTFRTVNEKFTQKAREEV